MKKLIFFTSSFPYGLGEMWKANELRVFIRYFDKIIIVPFSPGGNLYHPKRLPQNVLSEDPLFETADLSVSKRDLLKLFDENVLYYFKEFIVRKVFTNKQRSVSWLSSSLLAKRLRRHPVIQKIIKEADKYTVLYFYWGKGSSEVVPLLDTSRFNKIIVRVHGYDLFEDRNNGYMPYRKELLAAITNITPTSLAGYKHLACLYPEFQSKIRIMRCGTISGGLSKPSDDGVLRIVTCSMLVPLKRLHLLAESLHKLQFPIEWTHLGDGALMDDIKRRTNTLPSNIKFNLVGEIDSRDVATYYAENRCDIFVNTSSTEGVPFSVMEALSAGIPVMATDVGGTAEIIDDTVGKILPSDITPDLLATSIEDFYHLPEEEKIECRARAFERYLEKCDANKLAEEMGEFLSQ